MAKKRNAELQAERDAIQAANKELTTRAFEMFGKKLDEAERRIKELEKEMNHIKMHCIELEELIRYQNVLVFNVYNVVVAFKLGPRSIYFFL